jgi:type II/III secretion system protein
VQGGSDRNSVTIQFKEFGVRLNFTPTIVGDDLVKVKVRPEVSSLDFANALTIEGFRVPAISTRRTETEVELQDGQTFAIAGLMNNTLTSQMQKIPGIGDIPILGLLFKSKAAQKNQTELVVMITPQILRRGSTGVSPKLPDLVEPYMPPSSKTVPSPAPWNPGAPAQAAAQPVMPTSQPAPQPAARPSAPRVSRPALAEQQQPVQTEPVVQATPLRVQAEPVVQAMPMPVQPSQPAPEVKTAAVTPAKATKVDKAAAERARKADEERQKQALKQVMAEKKQLEARAKAAQERQEKEEKLAQQRTAEERKRSAKAAKEQARLQAELDRQRAEAIKRQAEQDKKQAVIDREKSEQAAEAQARLDQARKAYEAEIAKINAQNQQQ